MLRYKIEQSEFGLNVLNIYFKDESPILCDIFDFYKDQSNISTIYDQINEYVSTLPLVTQKAIYDIFQEISTDTYKASYNDIKTINTVENSLVAVSNLLDFNRFKHWAKCKEHLIPFPDNIRDDFLFDPDMNTTREKTYIKNEYSNLISTIVFIRALSPLYLDYYGYIKQLTSHYYYKIFMLFIKTDVYASAELEKLREYIEVNQITLIGATKNEHLIINTGLSDDDILDSLISEIIFNKLITIDFYNKKCNIISFIFQTIKYKGSFATADGGIIRSKASSKDPNKEDISYFEDYRKTSDIPVGTVVEIQHALSNLQMLVEVLGYQDFDYASYNEELKNVKLIMDKGVSKVQIYMLGWFLSKFINPRALYYIELRKVVELLLLAKIILIKNNQPFIAMLLSSYRTEQNNYINVIVRNGVNKQLVKKINPHYTFVVEEDKVSIIEKTIAETSKEIVNYLWVPIGSEHQLGLVKINEGYLQIPNDINDLICQYIQFVHSN